MHFGTIESVDAVHQNTVLSICAYSFTVVQYSYDSWGRLLSTSGSLADTIGKVNPFLYRGYYFDSETGLYYLNSRYYDPQIGRFLNADGQVKSDFTRSNLFVYCGNNPINRLDPTGEDYEYYSSWGEIHHDRMIEQKAQQAIKQTISSAGSNAIKSTVTSSLDTGTGYLIKKVPEVVKISAKSPFLECYNVRIGVKALKSVSHIVGFATAVSYIWDIGTNYSYYGGFTKKLFYSLWN